MGTNQKELITYSRPQIARKYLQYYLSAANGKGHGIHSPFVFDFVIHVLNDRRFYPDWTAIEQLRRELEQDAQLLEIEDLGAGSALQATRTRSVASLARHAAKSRKLGRLLYRIARYYQPQTIVELGTSLGLSSAYLGMGAKAGRMGGQGEPALGQKTDVITPKEATGGLKSGYGVHGAAGAREEPDPGQKTDALAEMARPRLYTLEGAGQVADRADRNFRTLGLEAELIRGHFDQTLPPLLAKLDQVGLGFIDGNHRREPTLHYFNALMEKVGPDSVLIFDDIHWSPEMEDAWHTIRTDPRVGLSIDLFFLGLVFFREDFKIKQDFTIRY